MFPGTEKGEFHSSTLPDKWERANKSFQEFVLNLVLQSYSPSRIKALLQSMKLPYSPEQIEEINEEIYQKVKELKTRELPENLICLFIDAYHTSMKHEETDRVKKTVI